MARLRLFGPAREAAGTGSDECAGVDVDSVLATACDRYGSGFVAVLRTSTVWLNGEPVGSEAPVGELDEVAVLPPVSGG